MLSKLVEFVKYVDTKGRSLIELKTIRNSGNINLENIKSLNLYKLENATVDNFEILYDDDVTIDSLHNMAIECKITKMYTNMKKYFLTSYYIFNDIKSLHELGYYYQYLEKDYNKMKKYYNICVKNNYIKSMNNLGIYYHITEKNNKKAKYYYELSISHGSITSLCNFAVYYQYVEKDYDKMIEKYLLFLEKSDNQEYNKHVKKAVNSYIRKTKNKKHIIACRNHLDKENNKEFNSLYVFHCTIKNNDDYADIIEECLLCKKYNEIITLFCSHEVCYQCYTKIEECPTCNSTLS